MVWVGGKRYDSFEELGNAILASLPDHRLPVRWWRGWGVAKLKHSSYIDRSPLGRLKAWLPHLSKSRSLVGLFFFHVYLFNKWCILLTCGVDSRKYEYKGKPNG